jgi:transcriptional regulator CtsR
MKKLCYSILFVFIANFGTAQPFKTESSEMFDVNIGIPVLLMKNGTTVFQNAEKRKMFLTIFDKNRNIKVNHKLVVFTNVEFYDNPNPTSGKSTNMLNWIELKEKIVLYLKSDVKAFKIIINPSNGEVEEELEMPLQFEKESIYESFCVDEKGTGDYKFKRVCTSTLNKRKTDPSTGNYVQINSSRIFLSKEQAMQRTNFDDIQTYAIKIFDSNNKEIQTLVFDELNKKYNSGISLDILFDNNVIYSVFEMSNTIDIASYNGGDGTIYFCKYDLSSKKSTIVKLFESDGNIETCRITPNKDNSFFNAKFLARAEQKDNQIFYDIFFVGVDVVNSTAGKQFRLPSDKLNEFVKSNCNIEEGYEGGMLDKCFVDKEGNILTSKIQNVIVGSNLSTGAIYTLNPELIGISYFDKNGKEIGGWAYPWRNKGIPLGVYQVQNNFAYTIGRGSKGSFIFLNDLSDNYNLPLNKKPKAAKLIEDCNAMAIELTSNGVKQFYLFGEPAADKENNKYLDFTNVLYDKNTNTIIAREYEGPGCKKTHAAWIKLD